MSNLSYHLIFDPVIGNITPDLGFAVQKGAASNSFQRFEAQTNSTSSININCNIPSESVVLNRKVLIQSQINFEIEISKVPVDTINVFTYGLTAAVQAFSLNSLFNNVTASINNANVSVNLKDILPSILLLNNNEVLSQYNSSSACMPDRYYKNYSDSVGSINNVLGGYQNSLSNSLNPR